MKVWPRAHIGTFGNDGSSWTLDPQTD